MTIEQSPRWERSFHFIFESGDGRIGGELLIGRGDKGARFTVLFS
jgi:hypothetical protein